MTIATATTLTVNAYGAVPTALPPDARVWAYRRMKAHGIRFTPGLDLSEYAGGKYRPLVGRYRQWEEGQPLATPVCDLGPDDYLICPRALPDSPVRFPEWGEPSRASKNVPAPFVSPSASAAWLFGLYIADGNAVPNHKAVITLGIDQTETVDRAVAAWAEMGLAATVVRKPTFARVIVNSAVAANSFREWFGTSSAAKRIPDFLWSGWDTRAILEGIAAGDGCQYRNRQIITTTSFRLAVQIQRLLVSRGERPSLRPQPRNGGEFANAAPGWTVTWHETTGKKQLLRHWRDYYLMAVRSVSDACDAGPTVETEEGGQRIVNNILLAP